MTTAPSFPGMLFAGSTDRAVASALSAYDGLNPWSAALRIRPLSIGTAQGLMVKGTFAGGNRRVNFSITTTGAVQCVIDYSTTDLNYATAASVITANVEHLIGVTFNSANGAGERVRFYVQSGGGPLQQLTPSTATEPSGSPASDAGAVFALFNSSTGAAPGLNGYGYWALLSRAEWSLEDFQRLADDPSAPMSGVIGRWVPGKYGGTTIVDESGYGGHLTVTGAKLGGVPLVALPGRTALPGYEPLAVRWKRALFPPAASFKAAWARGSNLILQQGLR